MIIYIVEAPYNLTQKKTAGTNRSSVCILSWHLDHRTCFLCIYFVTAIKTNMHPCQQTREFGIIHKCSLHYVIIMYYSMATWWRHQMETSSALPAMCAGNSPVIGEFPTQRPVCAWFTGWTNNPEAGDLRRYHAHYDVAVMGHCFIVRSLC